MLSIGKEIEENFKNVGFELRLRYKSFNSFYKKIEKITREPITKNRIYDNNKIKIIVNDVPSDYKTKDLFLADILEEQRHYEKLVQKTQDDLDTFVKEYIDTGNKQLYKIAKDAKLENVHDKLLALDKIKDAAQMYISKNILEFLLNDSKRLSKYEITNIPDRRKSFNTTVGYVAEHATLESKKLNNWVLELQSKSSYQYEISRVGSAAHEKREGKERILPDLTQYTSISPELKAELENSVPTYVLYKGNSTLYQCGLLENFFHYYENQLCNNKEAYRKSLDLLSPYKGHEVTVKDIFEKENDDFVR